MITLQYRDHVQWNGIGTAHSLGNEGLEGEVVSEIDSTQNCLHLRNTRTCVRENDERTGE